MKEEILLLGYILGLICEEADVSVLREPTFLSKDAIAVIKLSNGTTFTIEINKIEEKPSQAEVHPTINQVLRLWGYA